MGIVSCSPPSPSLFQAHPKQGAGNYCPIHWVQLHNSHFICWHINRSTRAAPKIFSASCRKCCHVTAELALKLRWQIKLGHDYSEYGFLYAREEDRWVEYFDKTELKSPTMSNIPEATQTQQLQWGHLHITQWMNVGEVKVKIHVFFELVSRWVMRLAFWSLCVTGTSYVSMGSLLYDTHTHTHTHTPPHCLSYTHTLSHSPASSHVAYRRMYESGTIAIWISYYT